MVQNACWSLNAYAQRCTSWERTPWRAVQVAAWDALGQIERATLKPQGPRLCAKPHLAHIFVLRGERTRP